MVGETNRKTDPDENIPINRGIYGVEEIERDSNGSLRLVRHSAPMLDMLTLCCHYR